MTEEKKQDMPKEGMKGEQQKRQMIIETDGKSWNITKETNLSPLEIKEICREIIIALSG